MRLSAVTLAAFLSFIAAPALAASPDHLVGYAGAFDVFDNDDSLMIGGEYRFADTFNGLRPTLGVMLTEESTAYAYGGAYWDLPLDTGPFVISPGIVVGGYHQGAGKDLGSGIEFRSTMEISYKLDEGQRLGLAISHISNGSLGDDNPGAETVQLVYGYPMW